MDDINRSTPPQAGTAFNLPPPGRGRRVRTAVLVVVVLVALVVAAASFLRPEAKTAPKFTMAPVIHGPMVETIETTGTVNPLLQVQVGAQVSGRVAKVNVDFNSRVKKGEVLAQLESAPFVAQLAQAQASYAMATAQLARAKVERDTQKKNLERAMALRQKGMNAGADLDAAQAAVDSATAQVDVANAQVDQAQAAVAVVKENLGYTRILAPVDGTVISRNVDPGQTVAANFQAPTLFVIAHDLTTMRVIASIDESDVGKVQEGSPAQVRVEAFPKERFKGTVKELRIQPTTTQGVVTYPAVVDVPNPDFKLRPGMTATVTVITADKADVLQVPNAALRFKPSLLDAPGENAPPAKRMRASQVWVLKDGRPAAVEVETGITSGTHTEVITDALSEGDKVIVDEAGATAAPVPGTRNQRRGPPRIF